MQLVRHALSTVHYNIKRMGLGESAELYCTINLLGAAITLWNSGLHKY